MAILGMMRGILVSLLLSLDILPRVVPASSHPALPCPQGCHCQNQNKFIHCEHKYGTKLQSIPINIPTQVQELYLSDNLLTTVKAGQLAGLTNLTTLSFKNNQLVRFEPGAFVDLVRLEHLFLTNNKLDIMKADVFKGLESLHNLYISQNLLRQIPDVGFCTSLRKLNLDNNHLSSATFPVGFKNIPTITTIVLSVNNQIEQLKTSDFIPFKQDQIKKIDLSRCNIKSIEALTFTHFKSLQSLILSYNPIKGEDLQHIIKGLGGSTIVSLDLAGVINGGSLPNNTFEALDNVSTLNRLSLKRSKINVILNGTFHFLKTVTLLELSYAEILAIESGAFIGMKQLKTLKLDGNNLEVLPGNLPDGLQVLDLSHNHLLDTISGGVFTQLVQLTTLKLHHCIIKTIKNDAFDGLWNLITLDLSSNKIGGNSIGNAAMQNLANLKQLHLNNNVMGKIVNQAKLFSGLRNLIYLDLSGNNCETVPVGLFKPLVGLQQLFLMNNKLGQMLDKDKQGNILAGMGNLVELYLNVNLMNQLNGQLFKDLKNLTKLHLQENNIFHWHPQVFSSMPRLINLNLASNKIALVNQTSFSAFNMSLSINLTNNPFSCSCDMRWFRWWLNSTNITFDNLSQYKCYSPKSMQGQPLLHFHPNDIWFRCNWLYFLYGGIGGTVALILFSVFLIYQFRWKIRLRWYYIHRIKRMTQTPEGTGYQHLAKDLPYDAFVSCSDEPGDKEWVENQLLHKMDKDEEGTHTLYYGHRNDIRGMGYNGQGKSNTSCWREICGFFLGYFCLLLFFLLLFESFIFKCSAAILVCFVDRIHKIVM